MKKYYEEIYSDIQLLFVTPEWLFSSNNLDRVRELAINNKISLMKLIWYLTSKHSGTGIDIWKIF